MHMISKKDLSNAEMDTLTKSCSPTIVITANGKVQAQEEAIPASQRWRNELNKIQEKNVSQPNRDL